ncbi:ion channel [Flavobacteriaceae bacterium MHTCC 0001]
MGKKIKDPGIGNASAKYVGRLIDNNGQFNVVHMNKTPRFSEAYNYLLNISWLQFFGFSFLSFILANVIFALIYCGIGVSEITTAKGNFLQDFLSAFFFSSQTFTTLGYGAMAPNGIASGIVSSVEAFVGLMFFAFATGLLYGRFSKPRAAIRFSKHIVLNNFGNNKALMFRIENDRKSTMINPRVDVTLTLTKKNSKEGYTNNFYSLDLERDNINYLLTTWTIVHEIDKQSPLYNTLYNDLVKMQGELIVMVSYYDEAFNQEVHQMYSYLLNEIKPDYKFSKAYYYNDKGEMVLDHKRFDCIEPTLDS